MRYCARPPPPYAQCVHKWCSDPSTTTAMQPLDWQDSSSPLPPPPPELYDREAPQKTSVVVKHAHFLLSSC